MADWLDFALDGDGGGGGLTLVQQPVGRPDPVQRPGEAMPRARQAAPMPRAEPAQAAPADNTPEIDSWMAIRRKYDLPFADLEPLVDDLRSVQRSGQPLRPLPPALVDDLRAHGQRYPYNPAQPQQNGTPQPRQQAGSPQAARPAQPMQTPAQPPQTGRNDDFLFEAPAEAAPQPRQAPQAMPAGGVDPNAEPDATTWVGRRAQDIMGKTDKRYGNLPTIAEVMLKDKTHKLAPEVGSWLVGASDKDMTGVYRDMLGQRFVRDETDANGFPIVVYKDAQGQEARAYVNKPGLDMQDVVRGAVGIAPYVGVGRLIGGAMKGAALIPRMAGQSVGAAATSVGQDAAGVVSGVSDLDLEKSAEKAGIAALGGAGGEAIGAAGSAIWRKLVTEPKYFNRVTGTLTAEGEQAAQAAGINPKVLARGAAQDFAKAMARTGDPAAATRQTLANEFKIPRTSGEMAGDTQQLLREQQMLGGAYNDNAATVMKNFRTVQNQAIDDAVRGEIAPGQPGLAGQIAPDRAGSRLSKAELGGNIKANTESAYQIAKDAEKKAWENAPSFTANQAALDEITPTIKSGLQSRKISVIEEGLTPQAKKMDDMIAEFQAGKMPLNGSKYIDRDLPGDVDIMRQRLLAAYQSADKPRDIAASKALYDSFQDWMVVAAEKSGDPIIASRLLTARTMTRELHQAFDGMPGTPGANILKSILKTADSPELIVNSLFSGPAKSEIKAGGVDALKALKLGYDKYLPKEAAKSAWDDIRLAYVMRIIEQKTGEVGGPAAMATAIKSALKNQQTVANLLLSEQERGAMSRLAMLLDDVKKRNPNSSWSAIGVGALMKDISNALLSMIGANTIIGRAAIGTVAGRIQTQYGAAQARAATGGGMGATVPQLPAPSFGGVGGGIGAGSQR